MDLGKILAGKKERENAERNRKRLEGALETLKRLKFLRIADEEIRKRVVRLCYEADLYIAGALESAGAFYDPPLVDSLERSFGALNAFLKDENGAAAERLFYGEDGEDGEGSGAFRNRTLALLDESAGAFRERNGINGSGDLDRIAAEEGCR
jgi:hypothetical protein